MNPENDAEAKEQTRESAEYLFWLLRRYVGEFPNKVRVSAFFGAGDGFHMVEAELRLDAEQIQVYEERWQDFLRTSALEEATKLLKGSDTEAD